MMAETPPVESPSTAPSVTDDELHDWLARVPFSRPRRQGMGRDFSDAMLMAELIAHLLPRYIDLQHYMPASSLQLKKYNWQTLNKMVLSYLDICLSGAQIDALANGQQGVIEPILHTLRMKIELAITDRRFRPRRGSRRGGYSRSGSNSSLACQSDAEEESIMGTPRRSRRFNSLARHGITAVPNGGGGGGTPTAYQDMVPGRLLHAAQAKCYDRDEQINTLQGRLRHVQRLVALKDERIDDLTRRLDRLAQALAQSCPPPSVKPPTSEEQHAAVANDLMQQLISLRGSMPSSDNQLNDAV